MNRKIQQPATPAEAEAWLRGLPRCRNHEESIAVARAVGRHLPLDVAAELLNRWSPPLYEGEWQTKIGGAGSAGYLAAPKPDARRRRPRKTRQPVTTH